MGRYEGTKVRRHEAKTVAPRHLRAFVPWCLLLLAGCTTVKRSFPDLTAEQVWPVLVAVAETPDYGDWRVVDNEVWVDEEDRRIEIYRRLRRILHRPAAKPLDEQRTWRFQIRLQEKEPLVAVFVSRGWGVPAHAQIEGDRYFGDVAIQLSGMPAGAAETMHEDLGFDLDAEEAPDARSGPPD